MKTTLSQEPELLEPSEELLADFLDYCREFPDLDGIQGIGAMDPRDPLPGIQSCRDQARGINLPEGRIAADTLWLVSGGKRILGMINLRHSLTPYLAFEGGHVGYSVRPSERRKGYATSMLRSVKILAKAMGIKRLLVTCDATNLASAAVIEKCGGVFESEIKSKLPGREFLRRFWIELD